MAWHRCNDNLIKVNEAILIVQSCQLHAHVYHVIVVIHNEMSLTIIGYHRLAVSTLVGPTTQYVPTG